MKKAILTVFVLACMPGLLFAHELHAVPEGAVHELLHFIPLIVMVVAGITFYLLQKKSHK